MDGVDVAEKQSEFTGYGIDNSYRSPTKKSRPTSPRKLQVSSGKRTSIESESQGQIVESLSTLLNETPPELLFSGFRHDNDKKEIDFWKAKTEELSNDLEALNKTVVSPLKKKITELERENNSLRIENKSIQEELEHSQNQLARSDEKIKVVTKTSEELTMVMNAELSAFEKTKQEWTSERRRLLKLVEIHENQTSELMEVHKQLSVEFDTLKSSKDNLEVCLKQKDETERDLHKKLSFYESLLNLDALSTDSISLNLAALNLSDSPTKSKRNSKTSKRNSFSSISTSLSALFRKMDSGVTLNDESQEVMPSIQTALSTELSNAEYKDSLEGVRRENEMLLQYLQNLLLKIMNNPAAMNVLSA
ncbi:hypothetical protein BKA69DRAFT_1034715 [Paraphysoderma sedebokerense]|nr:hypothetical protein BKA69DRAFT_1034715 [Paraphysoderma sedebokerense]